MSQFNSIIQFIQKRTPKMSQQNNNKYYHNDYKKQMGIDDSRTTSQKLLDKVIKSKTQRSDRQEVLGNQETQKLAKRVKEVSAEPLTHRDVLQKLIKSIKQQASLQKLLKSLQILYKCLNDFNFVNDPLINNQKTWLQIWENIRTCISTKYFYCSESQIMMQNIADCITVILKRLRIQQSKETSQSLTIQKAENQSIEQGQRKKLLLQKIQTQKNFCRLFTDDSFVFNRSLKLIKNYIMESFQKTSSQHQYSDCLQTTSYEFLLNLLEFPLKHEWVKTSLAQFLKQFNVNHTQKLQQQKKSAYLKNYNLFLQKKCSTFNSSKKQQSFNIMQKSSGGIIKSIQISQNGTGAQKWISKQ